MEENIITKKVIINISIILFLALFIGIFANFFSLFVNLNSKVIIWVIIFLVSLFFLFKYPEITFGLFLVAGCFKADPRLQSILPDLFDLTIFFGLIAGISILFSVIKNKLKFPRISGKFFVPYFALVILMLASLLYTQAPIYGRDKFLRFITIGTLAAFGPVFLFKDRKKLHRFFYTLIIISSLMVIDSIISTSFASFASFGFRTAFGSNYLALGRVTGIVSLITLFYFLLISKEQGKKAIWAILFLLNIFGLLHAGGRAPTIAFVTILLLIAIFALLSVSIKSSKNKIRILKAASLTTLAVLLIILIFPQPFHTLIRRIEVIFTEPEGGKSISLRLGYYNSAIEAISQHPLFGLGIGGFSVFHSGIDQRLYPHNIFLEIGSELGILGPILLVFLIGFCIFYSLSLKDKYRTEKQYLLVTMILSIFVFMFINTLSSGDINDNRLFFVWLGTAYALSNVLKSENLTK